MLRVKDIEEKISGHLTRAKIKCGEDNKYYVRIFNIETGQEIKCQPTGSFDSLRELYLAWKDLGD